MVLTNLSSCIVRDNVFWRGYRGRLLDDRGGHSADTIIRDIRLFDHPIGSYMDAFTYKGEKDYGAALKEFVRPEIYPAYIHCAGGADRTGTLCFLLETLCGVSREL